MYKEQRAFVVINESFKINLKKYFFSFFKRMSDSDKEKTNNSDNSNDNSNNINNDGYACLQCSSTQKTIDSNNAEKLVATCCTSY